jgi:hypothetical protein
MALFWMDVPRLAQFAVSLTLIAVTQHAPDGDERTSIVEPQDVVSDQVRFPDGWLISDAGVRPVAIVAMWPNRQIISSLARMLVGLAWAQAALPCDQEC